ncbi:MAG: class I SAM-dependent methyltransferase [Acidimicrobiia bacterium]|nr:class I SAM-dependent methyltransferase [Acidimicrobiia bacterium]
MLTVDYDLLGLHAGDRLLDIGCGFGRHSYEALRRGADVVSSDFSFPELVEVEQTVSAMHSSGELPDGVSSSSCNGDVTRLPFPDGSFDRIIASEILEHIEDDEAAIEELVRVLRPGGTFAATVPATLPEQICWKLTDEYHAPKVEGGHVRIYGRGELAARMETAGLEIIGSHRAHSLHSPYWWLRCAVGVTRDVEDNPLTSLYNRFLTWDIMKQPPVLKMVDRVLNPILGKSLVVYGVRPVHAGGVHPS